MQRYPAVRGRHVVVGLAEHGVEAVQSQELAEELVCHAVDLQKTFQFLQRKIPAVTSQLQSSTPTE